MFGCAARVPPRAACAWLVAWPLTQIGLLLEPSLLHFGGLSGVLHAGVAVVTADRFVHGSRGEKRVALIVGAGLVAKLVGEHPMAAALQHPAGWDIATAPFAHVSGTVAGLLCGGVAALWPAARCRTTADPA